MKMSSEVVDVTKYVAGVLESLRETEEEMEQFFSKNDENDVFLGPMYKSILRHIKTKIDVLEQLRKDCGLERK